MGLEKGGEMYITKSGKGVLIRIDSQHVSAFTIYLVAPRVAVEALLKGYLGKVPVKVITK